MTDFYIFQFLFKYFTLHNVPKDFTLKKEHLRGVTIEASDLNVKQLVISEKTILTNFRLMKSI